MRQELQHSSTLVLRFWSGVDGWIILVELFSQWCDWWSESSDFGIALVNISWLNGISMLESQLRNWGMFKISRSSSHNAMDQRSWDSEINWRSHDFAIEYGTKRFHRLRYAWCDDCVCIEKTSRQACSFPKRVSLEEQPAHKYHRFLRGRQNCLHDLWACPCNRSLWSGTRTLRFVQVSFAEWRRLRFRRSMGSSSIISTWYAFRNDLGRIVHVKIARLLFSFRPSWLCTIKKPSE